MRKSFKTIAEIVGIIIGVLLSLSFVIAEVYIALHFIVKFW